MNTSCGTPEIDATNWRCEEHSDCGSGWVCDSFQGWCVVADSDGKNGVFDDRLVLGMTAAFSGVWEESGLAARAGFQAYADHVNRTGGVAGRKLQDLEELDDAGDPDTAEDNAATLLGNDRSVFALVASTASGVSEKLRKFSIDNRVLLFAPLSGSPVLRKANPDRYVYNFRASLAQEMPKLLGYFTQTLQPNIVPKNIAVFAQGEDDAGTRDEFGETGFDAVAAVLGSGDPKVSPNDILAVTHEREAAAVDVTAAVTGILKWLGSGNLEKTAGDKIDALVVLVASPEASAPLVRDLLNAVSLFRGGEGPDDTGEPDDRDYGLSTGEKAEVAKVERLLFASTAAVDSVELADELEKRGKYEPDDSGTERTYCDGLMSSQVLPDLTASSTGVDEFRRRLRDSDPTQPFSYAAFEGYTLARLLVEGLRRHGPDLTVETFTDTLESLDNVDIGVFQDSGLGFSPGSHQASDEVRGTRVNADCTQESILLANGS